MRISSRPMLLVLTASLWAATALAVDMTPEPSPPPELVAGRRAIEARDWQTAIKSLQAAVQREPRNADAQNLLGFAYRNTGLLEAALKHYQRALQLDPRHLSAHEYIGEAYLMANDLGKAEEHLAVLRKLCPMVCTERDDLSNKIAAYRARSK